MNLVFFIFYYNNQQFNEFGTIIHVEKISRKIICLKLPHTENSVNINKCLIKQRPIVIGVTQGSVLGPTLLLIFI